MRRVATLTCAELEANQVAKFRQLVHQVNERSPYHRKIIAERGIDVARCDPKAVKAVAARVASSTAV